MGQPSKPAKPSVVTYGDHEIITPDTSKLRKLVRQAADDEPDPVENAEKALAEMSNQFADWMAKECDRLDAARRNVKENGMSKKNKNELFLAAHDVKGDSSTFGYAAVSPAADSLCRLLEHTPEVNAIPIALVDQHVDAVRAIVREYKRDDILMVAQALTDRLRQVTDEFLVSVNKHRPEHLRTIISPPLVPDIAS